MLETIIGVAGMLVAVAFSYFLGAGIRELQVTTKLAALALIVGSSVVAVLLSGANIYLASLVISAINIAVGVAAHFERRADKRKGCR